MKHSDNESTWIFSMRYLICQYVRVIRTQLSELFSTYLKLTRMMFSMVKLLLPAFLSFGQTIPVVDVINNFRVDMLRSKKAIWLVKNSHGTLNSQSECFISAQCSNATLEFVSGATHFPSIRRYFDLEVFNLNRCVFVVLWKIMCKPILKKYYLISTEFSPKNLNPEIDQKI